MITTPIFSRYFVEMDTRVILKIVLTIFISGALIALVVVAIIYGTGDSSTEPKTWPTPGPMKPDTVITSPPVPSGSPTSPPTICGPGTKIQDGKCVLDFESYRSTLGGILDTSVIDISGSTTYVGMGRAVMQDNQKPWEANWEANRGLGISEDVGCACGDCAGWRGGNATNCSLSQLSQTDDKHRVQCIKDYSAASSSKCVCGVGYSPVNGMCVRGYEQGCPKCVLDGTCPGRTKCDSSKVLRIKRVGYPGTRYVCEGKTGDLAYATQGDLEKECKLANEKDGMSEYECAMGCEGQECSKECLPELWVWGSIKVGDSVVGYYQTGELVQFAPTSYSLSTCNPYVTGTVSGDVGKDCEECTSCKWVADGKGGYDYRCASCDRCNGTVGEVSYCRGAVCGGCDISGRCKECTSVTNCNKYSRNPKSGCTMGIYNKGEQYVPYWSSVLKENLSTCWYYRSGDKKTTCDNGIFKDGGVIEKSWLGTDTLTNY